MYQHQLLHYIHHHVFLGVERFYVFDAYGLYESLLQRYINSGLVIYVIMPPVYSQQSMEANEHHLQIQVLHICKWLARLSRVEWLLNLDYDEWLVVPSKHAFLQYRQPNCLQFDRNQSTVSLVITPPTSLVTMNDYLQAYNGLNRMQAISFRIGCYSLLLTYLTVISNFRLRSPLAIPQLSTDEYFISIPYTVNGVQTDTYTHTHSTMNLFNNSALSIPLPWRFRKAAPMYVERRKYLIRIEYPTHLLVHWIVELYEKKWLSELTWWLGLTFQHEGLDGKHISTSVQ